MLDLRAQIEYRLRDVAGLSPSEVSRVAGELLDLFGQTVDQFIEGRHIELQRAGYKSHMIYERIQTELDEWRFSANNLSLRQIRRRIHG